MPEKALSAGRLYGYRVFDDDDTLSYAWISFTADNPAAVTEEQVEENAFDDYTNMNCGAYVNGYVYGFAENGYFTVSTPPTGAAKGFCRCKQL